MIAELCAEALFVSPLQPSETPTAAEVDTAVTAMLLLYGTCGCAEMLAQEFGDHPEVAAERMCWCLAAVRQALAGVSAGAR